MALKVGNDMKFYYNTGTNASPTWVLISMIGDLTVDISIGEAEIDLRITNWMLSRPSKLSGSFSVAFANDIGGTVYDALRAFALARTQAQFASANAAIATSGTEYFKAFGYFSAFPWAQPTQEVSSHDATIAFGYSEEASALVEPAWATTP